MKRLIISTCILCALAVPYAYSQTIGDPASGGGTNCRPDRITKAVVELPRGQTLVLRNPVKHTQITYKDRRIDVELLANKHGASVDSPNGVVGFSAKCDG